MEIEIKNDGSLTTIFVKGRIDTMTAPELENAIGTDLEDLTIDFTDVNYISSAGLRVLLMAQKKVKGALKIAHPNNVVLDIFKLTGLDQALTIED